MSFRHQNLAEGRWRELTLAEQLGNVGSEVSRALKWRDKDEKLFQGAFERALELLDLTLQDPRWRGRLKEIARSREVFCDAVEGGEMYNSTLEDMDYYFTYFAHLASLARLKKTEKF